MTQSKGQVLNITIRCVLQLPPFQNEQNKHGWCYGWTALHAACARAQHQCVELLIAAGADVNAQDQLYRTPLDVVGYAHYMGYKIEEKE